MGRREVGGVEEMPNGGRQNEKRKQTNRKKENKTKEARLILLHIPEMAGLHESINS
jgi:hypothetical protein